MNRGQDLHSIPNDLIVEIFLRLPAKSIARFRCLSKIWGSMLCRPYFTELFLTRSSASPRLLFAVKRDNEWSFYFSPQHQNLYGKSSIVVAAGFYIKFPKVMRPADFCGLTCGLIYFSSMRLSTKSEDTVPVICNPRTRQYALLPKLKNPRKQFLGFDPIDKQYKVLSMDFLFYDDGHQILTLGDGIMRWRKIQCPLDHNPYGQGICISGVLYYLNSRLWYDHVKVVCFDVRSEKFKFSDTKMVCDPYNTHLINYKGKLGVISWKYDGDAIELRMWVLVDIEKHEWSEYVYNLTVGYNKMVSLCAVVGVTPTGEIVLSEYYLEERMYYVFYFNPERKTLQCVEIQGLETEGRVYTFMDHVEDLNVNDVKQLKASRGLNIIRQRPKP